MAKYNAANAMNLLIDNEEAGEISEDELEDECEYDGDDDDFFDDDQGHVGDEEEDESKAHQKIDAKSVNFTIAPSSSSMSFATSADNFKSPYIPSANSCMSIACTKTPTPKKKIDTQLSISTKQFFAPNRSTISSENISPNLNPGKFFF
jgi:hypothetical protein